MSDIHGKSLFQLILLFWIIMDSVGTLPIFVSLLKHFPAKKQRAIIFREMLIALAVMILFLFFGTGFYSFLNISHASLETAGGIILFLLAVRMIFSIPKDDHAIKKSPKEPLIVPLAVPLIAGPGILATMTLYGGGIANNLTVLLAIFIAWLCSLPLLLFSPFLTKVLGENGIVAIERLFGYVLVLISSQMVYTGLRDAFA